MVSPWLLLMLLAAEPSGVDLVNRAQSLVDDFKCSQAEGVLDQALASPGLKLPQYLQALELRGVCACMLKKAPRAQESFRRLAVSDPERTLPAQYGPRIRTPFMEAKAWAIEQGPIRLVTRPATTGETMSFELHDPLGTVRGVRLSYRADPAELPMTVTASIEPSPEKPRAMEIEVPSGKEVFWWAVALNERGSEVYAVGQPDAPQIYSPAVPFQAVPRLQTARSASKPAHTLRKVSLGLLGGAAVAGAAGAYFGHQSQKAQRTLDDAQRDSEGRITSITQVQGFAITDRARRQAHWANAMFISAGVLAATGVGLWVGDLWVTPQSGGVAVSGVLP